MNPERIHPVIKKLVIVMNIKHWSINLEFQDMRIFICKHLYRELIGTKIYCGNTTRKTRYSFNQQILKKP